MLVAKREVYSYHEDNHVKETKKNNHNRKSNFSLKLKLFGIALLTLFVCLGVLIRYAQMTQIKMEVTKLDKEISELSKHKTDISLELEKIKESGWIEKEAESRLGMVYPTNEQVVFVSVNLNNEIDNNIAKEEKTVELGIFKLFTSAVNKLANMF